MAPKHPATAPKESTPKDASKQLTVSEPRSDEWMAKLPPVAVLILTYDRPDELRQTVQALRDNLIYPANKLHWFIADDATPGGVEALAADPLFEGVGWIVNDENKGWGATVNRALASFDGNFNYVYFTEDDYVLTKPLELWRGVALLEAKPKIGMVRYRGTGGDNMIYHGSEADVSALAPNAEWREAPGSYVAGRLSYLALGQGSPSPYLYSNGPHLRNRAFTAWYGPYAEGRQLGVTEEAYAVVVKTKMIENPYDSPAIVILPEWIAMAFDHIGQSRQLTEADKGTGPGVEPPSPSPEPTGTAPESTPAQPPNLPPTGGEPPQPL